jgi:hypothetical protein
MLEILNHFYLKIKKNFLLYIKRYFLIKKKITIEKSYEPKWAIIFQLRYYNFRNTFKFLYFINDSKSIKSYYRNRMLKKRRCLLYNWII